MTLLSLYPPMITTIKFSRQRLASAFMHTASGEIMQPPSPPPPDDDLGESHVELEIDWRSEARWSS